MKTILYYRKVQYGQEREFVHPDCQSEARALRLLTRRGTIDNDVRGLVQMLTAGEVEFKEVLAP